MLSMPHVQMDASHVVSCRFNSIGLRKYGINSLKSLLISLVPPAIFIAVMAMQLRYFSPVKRKASEASRVDLSTLLPANLRSTLSQSSGQAFVSREEEAEG